MLDRVEVALESEPTRETRNVKMLRPGPLAKYKYELRAGNLRVFFDVEEETGQVLVLAIGRKEGSRLWIGGKEVAL